MQHTTNTLPGNHNTHTQQQPERLNTLHTQHPHKKRKTQSNTMNTWTPGHSAHDGQGKENTRQRNEDMNRHMNRRRHIYMYNK